MLDFFPNFSDFSVQQFSTFTLMATSASPSAVAVDAVASCDDSSSISATLSTYDDSEVASLLSSASRQHLEGIITNDMPASIVGLCHPLLDLVATIDDFEAYGLEPSTQRLAKGGELGLSCQLVVIGKCLQHPRDREFRGAR